MLQDGMVFSSPDITLNAEPKEVGKLAVNRGDGRRMEGEQTHSQRGWEKYGGRTITISYNECILDLCLLLSP